MMDNSKMKQSFKDIFIYLVNSNTLYILENKKIWKKHILKNTSKYLNICKTIQKKIGEDMLRLFIQKYLIYIQNHVLNHFLIPKYQLNQKIEV